MKKRLIARILIFALLFNSLSPVFADSNDTTPKPYDKDELPQGIKDLRRFEIITLGALPFVTLDTSLAYSTYRYVKNDFDSQYKPDIFSQSSFNQDEQLGIIITSLGVCVGIGITDLIVQLVKRSSKKKKERQITYNDISVIPISEDPEASEIPLPEGDSKQSQEEIQEIEE